MRIIAGTHRGRPLRAPRGMSTRPTTDRVREALFGILGDLDGMLVVDCYAGTGALGLEALSRGARRAFFIESGRQASAVIARNAESLGFSDRCQLVSRPVERAAAALETELFDLVLSDPPWPIHQAASADVLKLFVGRLAEGATVVLGHPKRTSIDVDLPSGLSLKQTRNWGDSAMTFFEYRQAAGDACSDDDVGTVGNG